MSFKRFLVTDLFEAGKDLNLGDWVEANNHLPSAKCGIFKVRLDDKSETVAYFYKDRIEPMMKYYDNKSSYWWDKNTKEPLYNVVSWKGKLNDS